MHEIPAWVLRMMSDRLNDARVAYESVKESCDVFGISESEYLKRWLDNLPPITWTR